ncbi:hypothetical protein E2C01_043557 [Portunus trituberculatus]|uniref:Uncharacterized protein n=1 Tax=Portunus trituberculatus TaxID=210409 RepID=A0A5B7FWP5_PORTR|nr:hypothetical protein [Portunus trituberculatus]
MVQQLTGRCADGLSHVEISTWQKEYFLGYLLSQSPTARKPLPRVRKPNLHSDCGQDSNLCAWNPSDSKARMVPL